LPLRENETMLLKSKLGEYGSGAERISRIRGKGAERNHVPQKRGVQEVLKKRGKGRRKPI